MWRVNRITIPTGETGSIFGGAGDDVGPRALGEELGPEGCGYIVNLGSFGSISITSMGRGKDGVLLSINDSLEYRCAEPGGLELMAKSSGEVEISGGHGSLSVAAVRAMPHAEPIMRQAVSLASQSLPLQEEWDDDPVAFILRAGFPVQALDDLEGEYEGISAQEYFATAVQSCKFSNMRSLDEAGFRAGFLCWLCLLGLTVIIAAAVITIIAVIVANPEASAAIPFLIELGAVQAIAEWAGMTAAAVAWTAVGLVALVDDAGFVVAFGVNICKAIGMCDDESGSAPRSRR